MCLGKLDFFKNNINVPQCFLKARILQVFKIIILRKYVRNLQSIFSSLDFSDCLNVLNKYFLNMKLLNIRKDLGKTSMKKSLNLFSKNFEATIF